MAINIRPPNYEGMMRLPTGRFQPQKSLVHVRAPVVAAPPPPGQALPTINPADVAQQLRMAPPALGAPPFGLPSQSHFQIPLIAPRFTPGAAPQGLYRPPAGGQVNGMGPRNPYMGHQQQHGYGGADDDMMGDEDDDSGMGEDEDDESGPPRLQKTPGTLSMTPKSSGFDIVADPLKIHPKRIPPGKQSSKVTIPEPGPDDDDEDGGDGGDDGEEGGYEGQDMDFGQDEGGQDDGLDDGPMAPPEAGRGMDRDGGGQGGRVLPYGQAGSQSGGGPAQGSQGAGGAPMSFMPAPRGGSELNGPQRDKYKKLAELYNLQDQIGVEPYTRHYNMQTDDRYIDDALQRANQSVMESETVSLGESIIEMAASIVERTSIYGNAVLEQRGSASRLPELEGLSWFVGQPEIKQRFREPLKRIHELHGSKVRSINPFWALTVSFVAVTMQYGDAKNSRSAREQQAAQQAAQQQAHQMQMQQLAAMQQQMAHQQAVQQQHPGAQAQVMQQQQQSVQVQTQMNPQAARLAAMRQRQQERQRQEQQQREREQEESSAPSAARDVEITGDVDADRVRDSLRRMTPMQRRHISEQIAHAAEHGVSVIAPPPPAYNADDMDANNEYAPPARSSGVRFHHKAPPPVMTRPVAPRGLGAGASGSATTGRGGSLQSRGFAAKPTPRPDRPKQTLVSMIARSAAIQRMKRMKQGKGPNNNLQEADSASESGQSSGAEDDPSESDEDEDDEPDEEGSSSSEEVPLRRVQQGRTTTPASNKRMPGMTPAKTPNI